MNLLDITACKVRKQIGWIRNVYGSFHGDNKLTITPVLIDLANTPGGINIDCLKMKKTCLELHHVHIGCKIT